MSFYMRMFDVDYGLTSDGIIYRLGFVEDLPDGTWVSSACGGENSRIPR
jgi:hypothetical protein